MKRENEIYCNMCGKKIESRGGLPVEDVLSVKKCWGYFSEKDGAVHEFDLCEGCYDRLTEQFVLPVAETEQKEIL